MSPQRPPDRDERPLSELVSDVTSQLQALMRKRGRAGTGGDQRGAEQGGQGRSRLRRRWRRRVPRCHRAGFRPGLGAYRGRPRGRRLPHRRRAAAGRGRDPFHPGPQEDGRGQPCARADGRDRERGRADGQGLAAEVESPPTRQSRRGQGAPKASGGRWVAATETATTDGYPALATRLGARAGPWRVQLGTRAEPWPVGPAVRPPRSPTA